MNRRKACGGIRRMLSIILTIAMLLGFGSVAYAEESHEGDHIPDSPQWYASQTEHWKVASCLVDGCGKRIYSSDGSVWSGDQSTAAHEYDGDEDATCNVCGYLRFHVYCNEGEHTPSDGQWYADDAEHYMVAVCTQKMCGMTLYSADGYVWSEDYTAAAHEYDEDADAICNYCGYDRYDEPCNEGEHTPSEWGWYADSTNHYGESVCSKSKCRMTLFSRDGVSWSGTFVNAPHVYDDDADVYCNDCNYFRGVSCKEGEHIISQEQWYTDGTIHWIEAVCSKSECKMYLYSIDEHTWSDEFVSAPHRYDNDADIECNDCGYVRSIESETATVVPTEQVKEKAQEKIDEPKQVILSDDLETAILSSTIEAPAVIDMTRVSELSAVVVEKLIEGGAANINITSDLVIGISNTTLNGVEATPITLKEIEAEEVVGTYIATADHVPAGCKLIIMSGLKGATLDNVVVVYQFYGAEKAGQQVSFYAADANGTFNVIAISPVYENGYAAFCVPAVGFVGYAD